MTAQNDLNMPKTADLKRRFRDMKVSGIVFLCVGGVSTLLAFIVFNILLWWTGDTTFGPSLIGLMHCWIWFWISFLELIAGIILMILAHVVVRPKIHDQEVRVLPEPGPEQS